MTEQEIETFVTNAKAFDDFENARDEGLIEEPLTTDEEGRYPGDEYEEAGGTYWCENCGDYEFGACENY